MRQIENHYMDYEDRGFGGPSPNDYQDGIFSGQFNFVQPPVQPQQGMFGQPAPQPVQPVQPIQPVQPVQQPLPTDYLVKQILGQGTTNWTGQGYGSAEANAADMAKILSGIGITDINQFGRITRPVESYIGTDDLGNAIYETRNEETFGNKLTGQAVPTTYSERQKGDFFGGTFEGKGNTGYGVQFDEQGNPRFYTQGASSSDMGKIAPLLTMASFVPGLAPIAQGLNALMAAKQGNILGAISGAAGLGGLSDIANAANFAGAIKSGNPLAAITTGANLGGIDLGGLVDSSGIKDFTKIGDYDITDVVKAAQTAKAIKSGDPSAIISALGDYASREQEAPFGTGPSEPSFEPSETPTTSRFAAREVPDPFSSVNTEPVPSIEMPDLMGDYPGYTVEPPMTSVETPVAKPDQSFGSAFAEAREKGQGVFEWNGKPYTTDLASKQPTYDSVGGGRGGQGGATAEEIAAYNRSQTPTAVAKPRTAGDLFTSLFPSAEASTLPSGGQSDSASQIPGQSVKAPPSTYNDNNSVFGRVADELGLPQEFQRNLNNTLSALPGVNLPFGGLARGIGAADEGLAGLSSAGKYAPEASRLTAEPNKLFKMIDSFPANIQNLSAVRNAEQALANGDAVAAFRALESNPSAKKAMLDYANKLGYQEVSPFKVGKLFNPAEYTRPAQNLPGGLSQNPINKPSRGSR